MSKTSKCETCGGSGKIKCNECCGTGVLNRADNYSNKCFFCAGLGEIPCPNCQPAGELVKELQTMAINLKAIGYNFGVPICKQAAARIEALVKALQKIAFIEVWGCDQKPQGNYACDAMNEIARVALGEETQNGQE